jgi:hypothetical protein
MAACGEVYLLCATCAIKPVGRVMMEAVWTHYGGIDVLVRRCRQPQSPTGGCRRAPWTRCSTSCCMAPSTAHGRRQRWIAATRRILNIVATYVQSGSAYVTLRATPKPGVVALTIAAVEWSKHNIRCGNRTGPFPGETPESQANARRKRANIAVDRIRSSALAGMRISEPWRPAVGYGRGISTATAS